MAKTVEITFAIGAALTGGFSNLFGKAAQAVTDLQKKTSELQKASGQVADYQKLQGAIKNNVASMLAMKQQSAALDSQITASSQKTEQLKSQYRNAQAETDRLNAALVRSKDAYSLAQVNAQSLKNQIKSSSAPTAELQRQYAAAQAEVRKLGNEVKQNSAQLKNARAATQALKTELQSSTSKTREMSSEAKNLNAKAERLQSSLDRDREALSKMRSELSGAGIDTRNLAAEQQRLIEKSKRAADVQMKLQASRAALAETKGQLTWNSMRDDLLTAAGMGYSLYKPIMQSADFEQAMARVNAVAFSGGGRDKEADAEAFKALQEQARQLGRDTQYTATQEAQSQENLARAGFKANEIISAMPGLLSMAAAEGMDLANAADIAASTLRGFNLSADQSNRVADVLAQTSAASNTSIAGLGESMKMVAPVAAGLGVSVEQTAAMLGVMGNAGIKGSQAGTALRAAFSRLSKEPKAVAKALGELGIKARDSNGRLREMPELMQALSKRMKDMGEADQMQYLINIFGQEAGAGMLAVMRASVDGSLEQLEYLNKESNGIMNAIIASFGDGASKISLDEMRAGMKNAEPVARQLGISYKDLSVYLAVLNANSMKGANVDKALTTAFTQLAKQPKKVQQALKQYNLSAYDKDGRLREFPELLREIGKATENLNPEEQFKAIENIFGRGTGQEILTMIRSMNDGAYEHFNDIAGKASGVSQEMAEKVMNTMRGAMTQASSALEGLMIQIGDVLLPTVTKAVTAFKDFISWLGQLAHDNPGWTKAIVGIVGGITALNVAVAGLRIAWLLTKLPFQWFSVGFHFMNARLLANAENVAEVSKKTGLLSKTWGGLKATAKGVGNAFKSIGSGLGKLFGSLMSAGKGLISGLFSPMGLKILAIAGIITAVAGAVYLVYKNWDKIKEWWNSWTIKDVFAVLKGYAVAAKDYVIQKWEALKNGGIVGRLLIFSPHF